MHNQAFLPKIDYTLLDPTATNMEVIDLCEKAQNLQVASVCITPDKVLLAKNELKNSNVLVCTVVSFPSGDNSIEEKVQETKEAIQNGADEIDVVINYKKIDTLEYLEKELLSLVELCHSQDNKLNQPITLKVIVESGLLSLEETVILTRLCIKTNVDFIKTSTGKVLIGAELEKVKVMHLEIQKANSSLKIKASGGLREIAQIETFLPYVDRLGIGHQTVDSFLNL
jgi:deoxyribose-phosphate aldolase